MKEIISEHFEKNFHEIFKDVVETGEHYAIVTSHLDKLGKTVDDVIIIIPYEDFLILSETYNEWVTHKDTSDVEQLSTFEYDIEDYDDPLQ